MLKWKKKAVVRDYGDYNNSPEKAQIASKFHTLLWDHLYILQMPSLSIALNISQYNESQSIGWIQFSTNWKTKFVWSSQKKRVYTFLQKVMTSEESTYANRRSDCFNRKLILSIQELIDLPQTLNSVPRQIF